MSARVCVAVPVRDTEAYLAEAVESVLAQDVDLEVRIVDNRSTDASYEIALALAADPRVGAARNDVDVGYYGSLNRALSETTCPLFVPFAADDVMAPGNLRAKRDALLAAGAGFACGPVTLIDEAGAPIGRDEWDVPPAPVTEPPGFFAEIAPGNRLWCPGSTVIDAAALRALGGFDGRLPYCADWLAWLRLSLRHRVACVPERLVHFRRHAGTGTTAARRTAVYATQMPAALGAALADPACPEPLRGRAPAFLAASLDEQAVRLAHDGFTRLADGPAAYSWAGAAWALAPGDAAREARFRRLVADAGLVAPARPAVAVTAGNPAALEAAFAVARRLHAAGALETLAVAAPPADTAAVAAAAETLLAAGGDLPVDLVAAVSAEPLLEPGRIALAPVGGALAAAAEARGVPALPVPFPDPLAAPPDPGRLETLAAPGA